MKSHVRSTIDTKLLVENRLRSERDEARDRIRELEARVAEQEGKIIELAERLTKEQARVAELEKAIEWAKAKGFIQVGTVIANRLAGKPPV